VVHLEVDLAVDLAVEASQEAEAVEAGENLKKRIFSFK
jgi:hypothetical protein